MADSSIITVKSTLDQFYSGVVFVVNFTNNLSSIDNVTDSIVRNFEMFHKRQFTPSEIVKMIPDGITMGFSNLYFMWSFSLGVCHCNNAISLSEEAYIRVLKSNVCIGLLYPPCIYNVTSKVRECFY